jgi:hypothetical protein
MVVSSITSVRAWMSSSMSDRSISRKADELTRLDVEASKSVLSHDIIMTFASGIGPPPGLICFSPCITIAYIRHHSLYPEAFTACFMH